MLLHSKSKMFSLHQKMEIMDEADQVVYAVESKALSIHNTTYVHDAQGQEVAVITNKPISLHETHEVRMASGERFEMHTELMHLMGDVIDLDGIGWQLRGDILQHNYEILNERGELVATTHQKWVSVHDVYYIDVLDESQADKIVCVYVALEKIIRAREQRREDESSAAAAGGAAAARHGSDNNNN